MPVKPAYYNEIDPFAAAWLRELINEGLIADGDVDERNIQDVKADDLRGFTQCHFFAGIGGWSYALRLAGWADDRAVWTGSCPCQPLSAAGRGHGETDQRDLWPVWFPLLRECAPSVVFGEQVAGPAGLQWLDRLCDDLEDARYAVAAADLCAPSVGAFHIRQRLFFVAESEGARGRAHGRSIRSGTAARLPEAHRQDQRRAEREAGRIGYCGSIKRMADTQYTERRPLHVDREDGRDGTHRGRPEAHGESGTCGEVRLVGDTDLARSQGRIVHTERRGERATRQAGVASNPWADAEWLPCRDGKSRPIPVEPALFPLAAGIPNRVGLLRGAGNAIVPQVAAEVIVAYMQIEADRVA